MRPGPGCRAGAKQIGALGRKKLDFGDSLTWVRAFEREACGLLLGLRRLRVQSNAEERLGAREVCMGGVNSRRAWEVKRKGLNLRFARRWCLLVQSDTEERLRREEEA